jgi:hypothetical protein
MVLAFGLVAGSSRLQRRSCRLLSRPRAIPCRSMPPLSPCGSRRWIEHTVRPDGRKPAWPANRAMEHPDRGVSAGSCRCLKGMGGVTNGSAKISSRAINAGRRRVEPDSQHTAIGRFAMEKIDATKQPRRPHYLREWMERRQITAAELARQSGASKGVISRWLDGASPSQEWHDKLRDFFHAGKEGIFRHPDDDWFTQFFEGRSREEIERIKRTLEVAFP